MISFMGSRCVISDVADGTPHFYWETGLCTPVAAMTLGSWGTRSLERNQVSVACTKMGQSNAVFG